VILLSTKSFNEIFSSFPRLSIASHSTSHPSRPATAKVTNYPTADVSSAAGTGIGRPALPGSGYTQPDLETLVSNEAEGQNTNKMYLDTNMLIIRDCSGRYEKEVFPQVGIFTCLLSSLLI